ncbi:DUF4339 domain-containing protein [Rubritalea spongiae]
MWYYTSNGQQAGPISQEELAEKLKHELPSDTLVWREGLTQWSAANETEAFKNISSAIPPTLPQSLGANPYIAPSSINTQATITDPYPFPKVKKASFPLLIIATSLALLSTAFFVAYFMANGLSSLQVLEAQASGGLEQTIQAQMDPHASPEERMPEIPELDPMAQLKQIFTPTFFFLLALTSGLFIWSTILGLIYLHRGWKILQPAKASTTPGMAVGFLFIPLFNLYWTFIAYWKWAQDWNKAKQRYQSLQDAPSVNENMFLGMAICQCASLILSIAGLGQIVLYFIGMKSMCDTINYAADQNTSNA